MNLFGRDLGPEEIASLVFMLGAVGVWIVALRRERSAHAWFKQWNADRKARREAEARAEGRQDDAGSADGPRGPRGPWG